MRKVLISLLELLGGKGMVKKRQRALDISQWARLRSLLRAVPAPWECLLGSSMLHADNP